jgi:hypothetical protein
VGREDPRRVAGDGAGGPAASSPRASGRWRDWPVVRFGEYLGRITVARRRAVLRPAGPLRLPRFRGAFWHSVLGPALKAVACTDPPGTCPPCRRPEACPYAALFESRARTDGDAPLVPDARVPGALVLDSGPWVPVSVEPGVELALDYLLVGRADLAPVMDQAIERVGRAGLGRARVPAALVRVDDRGGSLPEAAETAVGAAAGGLALELRTPLRLKTGGRYLRAFDPGALVRDVTFRVTLLGHHHAGLPWPAPWREVAEEARAVRVAEARTRWVEGVRYSARQGREIVMGGLVGRIALAGVGPELARVLGAASVLHAGKGAAVGLGEIGVEGGG